MTDPIRDCTCGAATASVREIWRGNGTRPAGYVVNAGRIEHGPRCAVVAVETLPALTLHAPWAYAVTDLGKRVENRTWRPPARLIGQRLAIHAGMANAWPAWLAVDRAFCFATSDDLAIARDEATRGAVVAVVTVAGWADSRDGSAYEAARSPWWIGPIGWLLTDVVTLPDPVPAKGRQGLWRLDAATDAAVREQLGRST